MANALYDLGREGFLDASISWSADNIKFDLTRGYTEVLASHQFVTDVTGAGGTRVSTTANLASKTKAAGVADAADTVFSAVASGAACNKLTCFKDTGVVGTSRLILFIDTATGLPVTPNGGDINLVFDNGTNKVFKL